MYPRPDRSDYVPNASRTPVDIGWDEGFFADGRPYRVECWSEDGMTVLTYFFSTLGLETLNNDECVALLEANCALTFLAEPKRVSMMATYDDADQSMWSVSAVVALEDETFIRDQTKLRPYAKRPPADG